VIKIKRLLKEDKSGKTTGLIKQDKAKGIENIKIEFKSLGYDKLRLTTLSLLIDCFQKKITEDVQLNELKNAIIEIENSKELYITRRS
jgi:hypothetical protein